MTEGERAIWRAVYAASWHQPICGGPGTVNDVDRARWCAMQACHALDALRVIADPAAHQRSSDHAIEVLR